MLFNKLGYETRSLVVKYKLKDLPEEVKFIPDQIDYHHALQIRIGKAWRIIDATYDSKLKGQGFRVNIWDGISATQLAEEPLKIKTGNEKNQEFEDEFRGFIKRLKIAMKEHEREIKNYTKKFNQILESYRNNL